MEQKKIKYCLTHLPIQVGDSIVSSEIWKNEFDQWVHKIKYPKVGRSHYYSMVNMIDSLFEEQYPHWSNLMHKQVRGDI